MLRLSQKNWLCFYPNRAVVNRWLSWVKNMVFADGFDAFRSLLRASRLGWKCILLIRSACVRRYIRRFFLGGGDAGQSVVRALPI
jgi:hypothetical protein